MNPTSPLAHLVAAAITLGTLLALAAVVIATTPDWRLW